jgi:hypothetical protein
VSARQIATQELDCDATVQIRIVGAVDHAHATRADAAEHEIAADMVTALERNLRAGRSLEIERGVDQGLDGHLTPHVDSLPRRRCGRATRAGSPGNPVSGGGYSLQGTRAAVKST